MENETRFSLEHEICELIKKDNNSSAHFIWSHTENSIQCRVVTLNPRHNTHFLLCEQHVTFNPEQLSELTTTKESYINSLYLSILRTIKKNLVHKNETLINYMIEWNYKHSSDNAITSYFSGVDLQEVTDKFYFEKERNNIIVFQVRLVSSS